MRTLLLVVALAGCSGGQGASDRELASFVDTLQAIDSHAHPMAFIADGAAADTDSDALPLDAVPPFDPPVALRPASSGYGDAQRALYGKTATGDLAGLVKARATTIHARGDSFPAWALDRSHIEIMLANRVAMGAGLNPPRFRWVAFVDALMLPLDTRNEAARTPDTKVLYPLEAKLLRRYLRDLGLSKLPTTLDRYQHDVVSATLRRQRDAGAVAIKFEAAYLRPLDFEAADSATAAAIYRRYVAGGVPSRADYKVLEDFLVRSIAREAGQLGLAVQIHSLDLFGGYYSAAGAAPHLLESLFSDPSLRGTHFVIVHGGWPLVEETMSQLGKPNVYADISMMDQVAGRAVLTRTLRTWLSTWPDKVLFGTDAFDGGAQQGWEQGTWLASRNARRALAVALNGMVHDGEITPERAKQLARMVMRENAMAAYRLVKTRDAR